MPNDQQIIATSITGEISIFSVESQKRTFLYETLPLLIQANKDGQLPEGTFDGSNTQGGPHQVRPKSDAEISNIMYICKTFAGIPGQENTVLVGAEDK